MKSTKTRDFKKLFAELPVEIKAKANKAFDLWSGDNSHPSLHFKRVNETLPIYSVRIDQNYRATCFKNEQAQSFVWFWIGSHSDYDKLLDSF